MIEDPDEAVEKVLAGLRKAEVPAGMERRILGAIEQNQSGQPRLWRLEALFRRSLSYGVGLALALVAIAAVTKNLHHGSRPAEHPARLASVPKSAEVRVAEWVPPPGPDSRASIHGLKPHASRRAVARKETVSLDGVESFPAPPMPLTAQEKLLLKLAHQGDPEELAMVIHRGAAVENEEETADFTNFFGQADKGDHE